MKLAHHYRTLGLRHSSSFSDVKQAYRRLVRLCHPDINPSEAAIERFIQINAAYTALCDALQPGDTTEAAQIAAAAARAEGAKSPQLERLNLKDLKRTLERLGLGNFQPDVEPAETKPTQAKSPTSNDAAVSATDSQAPAATKTVTSSQANTGAEAAAILSANSAEDIELKKEAYDQLRDLLRQQKFPRAIALVEGLAHRLSADTEINQWQAIVYQRWGRQLISQGQFHKAHLYLKKALRTDPDNPSLSSEVARDLGLLKHIQAAETTLSQS